MRIASIVPVAAALLAGCTTVSVEEPVERAVVVEREGAVRSEELSPTALKAAMPKTAREADDILARMNLVKIRAFTQMAMCPGWEKAPAAREIWTCALLRALQKAPDSYHAMVCLGELRWCGKPDQAAKVATYGARFPDPHVREFAALVAAGIRGK